MGKIKFYKLPGCPYCRKVEDKLDDLDLDYREVLVPKDHEDRTDISKYDAVYADVPTVDEVSGQTGVPVIVDEKHGVEGMPESDDIVEYLEVTYGD